MLSFILAACTVLQDPAAPARPVGQPFVLAETPLVPAENKPQIVVRTATPEDVAIWVLADLMMLPPEDRKHVWYVWIPPWGRAEWHYGVSFAVNAAVSRSSQIQHPAVLANGWLQRWDNRQLFPTEGLYNKIDPILDQMILNEPYFHDPQTGLLHAPILEATEGLHLAFDTPELATIPIMRADWAVSKMLTSIEGGRYLELRGLRNLSPAREEWSEEQQLMAQFAIYLDTAEAVAGDRRVGIIRSDVTGKPRAVSAVSGSAFNTAWLTEDVFDGDTRERNPIQNLLDNNFRGREIIWELPNGLHGFAITDETGKILDEAPAQLVTDSRVPAPHTARLQGGAISCIRCHATGAGLRPCRNDVASMLSGPFRILGDITLASGRNPEEEIAARYAGTDFDKIMRRGREDYEAAVAELTGGQMTVEQISDLVSDMYAEWRYLDITADSVVMELGFTLPQEGDEVSSLDISRELILLQHAPGAVAIVEDPYIIAIYSGLPIRRDDFDTIYGQLLFRSSPWRAR